MHFFISNPQLQRIEYNVNINIQDVNHLTKIVIKLWPEPSQNIQVKKHVLTKNDCLLSKS